MSQKKKFIFKFYFTPLFLIYLFCSRHHVYQPYHNQKLQFFNDIWDNFFCSSVGYIFIKFKNTFHFLHVFSVFVEIFLVNTGFVAVKIIILFISSDVFVNDIWFLVFCFLYLFIYLFKIKFHRQYFVFTKCFFFNIRTQP